MSVTTLSKAAALNPGDRYWFVPDLNTSVWTQKVDWYLNHQIAKSKRRESDTSAPMLVVSHDFLPAECVIEMPEIDSEKTWAELFLKTWTDLGRPQSRVFLPPSLSPDAFQKLWKAANKDSESSINLVASV